MLDSIKIQRRQSEIRSELATLVGNPTPTEDETRSIETLDTEFRSNETRYRAALIVEDQERQDAEGELETRSESEWEKLVSQFEVRQVAAYYEGEGGKITGQTNEVVTELRANGSYQGVPIPWQALETRAGETIAAGVDSMSPTRTMPLIDRLFPQSVAAQLGGSMINVGSGTVEYPISTAQTQAAWQATELGEVGPPVPFTTTERKLAPDHTLGVQMRISRKSLKQSGEGLESAVRRDMNGAMQQELDRVMTLGSGTAGEPLGLIAGAATYGITETAVGAPADWALFRKEVLAFMLGNAATGPNAVRALVRPEVWDRMDGSYITGTAVSEWSLMMKAMQGVIMSTNALDAPAGDETTAILSTSAGGVAPFFAAAYGAIDMIRDPYTDAASGQLRLTALVTMDLTASRESQLRVMTGIQ